MNPINRPHRRTATRCAAVLVLVLAAAALAPPRASAQLGSLVVTITEPQNGATVSGTTTVSASVTIIGVLTVAKVEFYRDGVLLGEDTSAPYSIPWNTTTTSNGSHTLTAIGRTPLLVGFGSPAVNVTVFNDLTPPSVTVTAPSSGALVRGSTTISANASDNVGVTGVQFRVDGVNAGAEDTTPPYSISWNTAAASSGPHAVTAVARDAAGNTTTSASVAVTVDNTAPAVSISSPAAGSTVSGSVTVGANASDNLVVAGVQFFLNGTPLGNEDTSAPHQVTWDTTTAASGSHVLTALARDSAGNTTTSAAVSVTVSNDTTGPTVAITSPAHGQTVVSAVTVAATAADNVAVAGVRFMLDGAPLGAELTAAPYSITWDTTTATDGSHSLSASARDAAGNITVSSAVTVTVANQAATTTRLEDSHASIDYTPTGGWMLGYTDSHGWSGGTVSLGFNAGQRATLSFTGTGVSWIGFRGPQTGIATVHLDGAHVATIDSYSPTEVVQAVLYTAAGLANGPHTLAIEVTRTKNDAASDYFVVIDAFDVTATGGTPPDTVPPAVAITSPSEGATASGIVTISAGASDNVSVAGVKFLIDGVQVGAEDTSAPYAAGWNTSSASNGPHQLTAIARDTAGNTTTSSVVNVTVANTAPPVAPAATRFEDTELAITYIHGTPGPGQPPAWFFGSRSRDWSNQTAAFNRSANSRAVFRFNGTSVSWIGFRAFWAGIARVYIDDVFIAEIDLFLPPCSPEAKAQGCIDEDDQIPVFTASNLTPGPHTLTIEVTGTRNPGATDNAVVVDGFDVAPPMAPPVTGTRIEETAASVTYTGSWNQGDTSTAWSGGTAALGSAAGSRASATFTGTEARVIGMRGPNAGIARIFLDGGFQAEVDLYYPSQIQGVIYTATGLMPGSHTLAVEVKGTKHAASAGTVVAVDAFDVRSRVEARDSSVALTGTWQEHMERNWSGTSPNMGGGAAFRSTTAGATADFAFTGTAVQWIASRAPDNGIADVVLDGVTVGQVDLYAAAESLQVPVFSTTGLASGPHTLRIVVTGQRNAAATNGWVPIDAFDLTLPEPAPPVTRIQQSDASIAYTTPSGTTGFAQSSANEYFSGGTVHYATDAGARATFTFTGTAVRWIGQRRRDSGIARVYLDGALVAVVDTFNAIQDEFQAAMWSATGLSAGTHTVMIEVTATKNGGDTCAPGPAPPCSSGYLVIIDAFEIF